jgi:hypothetical protein
MPGPEGAPVQQCTGATRLVIDVLAENQPQLPFNGDQHPVQALAAGTADPAFGDRVGRRGRLHPIQMIGISVSG